MSLLDRPPHPLVQPPSHAGARLRQSYRSLSEALDAAADTSGAIEYSNARGELEHRLPYQLLRQRSLAMARRLLGAGLARGDLVGVVAEMSPDFVETFFACQYAGLVAVPLPAVTGLGGRVGYEKQIANIVDNSDIVMALGPESVMGTLHSACSRLPSGRVLTANQLEQGKASRSRLRPLGPDEISHIQFSSGSTRFPQGIRISQRALMANVRSIGQDALAFVEGDRVASWLPYYHDMGLVGCLLTPLVYGLPIDYLYTDSFARRPLQWLKLISTNRCTIGFSPSFGYELCARMSRDRRADGLDLSRWRIAGVGGDMIKPTALETFAEAFAPSGFRQGSFVPCYGLAEATLAVSFQPLGEGVEVEFVDKDALAERDRAVLLSPKGASEAKRCRVAASCGKPLTGYRVEIRGESGEALPGRSVGEIFVQGPSLMDGRYERGQASLKASGDDAWWLATGDMGYLADGKLYIVGRRKEMIIVNGRNIWPQDLEWHAERETPGLRLRDTAAFSHQDESGNEVAVILAQCRSADEAERRRLKQDVQAAIYRNAGIACRVELIPPRSLPFTTSGKLMRSRAKRNWLSGMYATALALGAFLSLFSASQSALQGRQHRPAPQSSSFSAFDATARASGWSLRRIDRAACGPHAQPSNVS